MLQNEIPEQLTDEEMLLKGPALLDDDNKPKASAFDEINNSEVLDLAKETDLSEQANNRFLGIVYVMLSTVWFALMTVACKIAYQNNPNLNGFDYVLLRASSMALMSALQVGYLKLNIFDIKEGYRFKLFMRWVVGGIGMPTFFMGLKYIPASKWTLIFNIHPILVAILSYFLLKEQITNMKILAVFGSFIGVLLFTQNTNNSNEPSDNYYIGILWASFAWLCGTTVAILLRIINQHIHYAMSPFWFGITTLVESILILIFIPSLYNFSHYTMYDCSWFLISGVFNYMGQTLKSLAFKYEDASVVTPFGYFQVIYLFICDLVIFNYSFNTTDLLGAGLISVWLLVPELSKLYVQLRRK